MQLQSKSTSKHHLCYNNLLLHKIPPLIHWQNTPVHIKRFISTNSDLFLYNYFFFLAQMRQKQKIDIFYLFCSETRKYLLIIIRWLNFRTASLYEFCYLCCEAKNCLLECSYFDSLLVICYFVASVQVFSCKGLIAHTDV